jgi:hypothetical protein
MIQRYAKLGHFASDSARPGQKLFARACAYAAGDPEKIP